MRKGTALSQSACAHAGTLDYYFHRATVGIGRGYDMPHLTAEKRAAENGLRYDLLTKLYDRLEPTFDVSFTWPPSGR